MTIYAPEKLHVLASGDKWLRHAEAFACHPVTSGRCGRHSFVVKNPAPDTRRAGGKFAAQENKRGHFPVVVEGQFARALRAGGHSCRSAAVCPVGLGLCKAMSTSASSNARGERARATSRRSNRPCPCIRSVRASRPRVCRRSPRWPHQGGSASGVRRARRTRRCRIARSGPAALSRTPAHEGCEGHFIVAGWSCTLGEGMVAYGHPRFACGTLLIVRASC